MKSELQSISEAIGKSDGLCAVLWERTHTAV